MLNTTNPKTAPARQKSGLEIEGVIAFPRLCSSLGGAQLVRYSARLARITLADGREVKVLRSKLPSVDQWTSFNLADVASR